MDLADRLHAIAANHINQAVLGFIQTTTNFKKQQQLPRHVSIPDILYMQGQVARCYAETCFQKFVSDHWHGGSADKDADTCRGKEAQSRHRITKQKAAKAAAGRAAQGNQM